MRNHADSELSERLQHAVSIAQQAGAETLKHFRQGDLAVERKGDGSPVTVADREAEKLLRRLISERFPEDAILGEEFEDRAGSSGFCWALDPIDGTKSFIHGVPLYTTLVGVLRESGAGDTQSNQGEAVLGVIHAPATGETTYAAVGGGCWFSDQGGTSRQVRVNNIDSLSESLMLTSEVDTFNDRLQGSTIDVFLKLQDEVRIVRTWGDGYGYLMLATGRAELMIDPEMSLWDSAALKPIIEEAGGRFTDWQGERTVHSGDVIATNGQIHDAVLKYTKGR